MKPMTSHERFSRIYAHKDADRIPISDQPWRGTIQRWHREGLPAGMSYIDYFDLDHVVQISVDNSPRYPVRVLEENDDWTIETTPWGVTLRQFKALDSTPEFLDFKITTPDSWIEAKARMTASPDRINWRELQKNYRKWREQGAWIQGGLWFGFDVTHSWMTGTETLLIAMIEEPEWCVDMFNHYLDTGLALLDQVWDAGYHFDCITWPDDMGYRQHQFFSLDMYRELLKPIQKRAIEWAHAHGIKAHLHSCGDINPIVPELIEIGLDALNPLEVKAGMNPVGLKQVYGRDLVFHGGINAVLWDDREKIEAEMRRVIPVMKESGGYIFASDHSIPNTVSFDNFRKIIELVRELGSYH